MLFKDRREAGTQLAKKILDDGIKPDIVLSSSLEGFEVGKQLAGHLDAPIALKLTDDIRAPGEPRLIVAGVADDGTLWVDDALKDELMVSGAFIDRARIAKARVLGMKKYRYCPTEPSLKGKKVVIVDQGVSTGFNIAAGIGSCIKQGADHIVVASPVSSRNGKELVEKLAEDVSILREVAYLRDVNDHYADPSDLEAVKKFDFQQQTDLK